MVSTKEIVSGTRKHLKSRAKTWLLWLAVVRAVLGIAAIPLAPLLYRDNFLILVLMRPTKEVLLAGGFLARVGKVDMFEIVVAAIPLSILAVWKFYFLGREYSSEIRQGKMPGIGSRVLPRKKIQQMTKVLKKRGWKLVFLGRLAAFPSTMVAAAAGSSKMDRKQFLLADGIGGALSIVEVVTVGFLLGHAFDAGRIWVTVAGAGVLIALLLLLGRYLKKEPG